MNSYNLQRRSESVGACGVRVSIGGKTPLFKNGKI